MGSNQEKDVIIIIRKKIEGENSIEEIAKRISKSLNIPIVSMPYHSTSLGGMIKNIKFVQKIKSKVVHIISPSEAYLLSFLKQKKIITYHDLGTIIASRNFIYRVAKYLFYIYPAFLFADYITCVSNTTKNELTRIKKTKSNILVIYNFYDEKLMFTPKKATKNNFTILHIGTSNRKNLISTIKACKNLPVHLITVGKLSSNQKQLLLDYNLSFENEFDITYERIIHYYERADIVSFPSSYEGFGLPVIEANAMGRPVFAGDIPVLHEVGGNAALYVNPTDIEQIRKVIIQLQQDRTLYNHLVLEGLKNIKRFSEKEIMKQYQQLYERMINV